MHRANQTSFTKGHKFSAESLEKIRLAGLGRVPWNKGQHWSPEMLKKLSEAKKGRSLTHLSAHQFKKGFKPWNKGRIFRSSPLQIIRASKPYKEWREAIFKRDNYTCQICGQIGGKLNADHIKKFAEYPELRFELSNGRTLCVSCHLSTHNFGNRKLKILDPDR